MQATYRLNSKFQIANYKQALNSNDQNTKLVAPCSGLEFVILNLFDISCLLFDA